jgi:hypothetical protein
MPNRITQSIGAPGRAQFFEKQPHAKYLKPEPVDIAHWSHRSAIDPCERAGLGNIGSKKGFRTCLGKKRYLLLLHVKMETPVPRPSSPPALLNDPEEHRLFLKTMKTFANMKETFDRGRRATEHSFMVQNMTVKDGGQAIVGNVTTPRSADPSEETSAHLPRRLPDARSVALPRVEESPELAPSSPTAEQGEETQALGDDDDQ